MSDATELITALRPLLAALAEVDIVDPSLAVRLNARFPLDGPELEAVRSAVMAGLAQGWLCPRGTPELRFGRVATPSEDTGGYGIFSVDMRGVGPVHTGYGPRFGHGLNVDLAPVFGGEDRFFPP